LSDPIDTPAPGGAGRAAPDETAARSSSLPTLGRWTRDTLIVLGVALLLFGGTELGLRVAFPERVVTVPPPETLAYRFDPDYLIALRPGVTKTFVRFAVNGGDSIRWTVNEDGFRGPPLREAPELRVFVYGDSNVHARFSTHENSYVGRLESHLQEALGEGVEVVNAGLAGSGPDESLLRLAVHAPAYHPDVVVFHVFADNDFGDIVRNRLFELDADGSLRRTEFEATRDRWLASPRWAYARRLVGSLLTVRAASRALGLREPGSGEEPPREDEVRRGDDAWFGQTIRTLVADEYRVYAEGRPRSFSHFADHYDFDLATDPAAESSTVKRALMSEILARVDSLTRAEGIELVVLVQPSVIDVAPDNQWYAPAVRDASAAYRPTNLTDEVERICEERGLRCIDLFEPFLSNDPGSLYFDSDDHWNDRGQDLAAEITAQYLLDHVLERRP